jgi:hypothetical protein
VEGPAVDLPSIKYKWKHPSPLSSEHKVTNSTRQDLRLYCFRKRDGPLVVLASEVFKLYVQDWILLPILIVEVPPLRGVDMETLFFHGLA